LPVFSAKSRYIPRNIGVAAPPGEKVYEFIVIWEHEFGSLAKILKVFAEHEAKVLLTHSQLDAHTNTVVGTFFCETAQADGPMEDLQEEIAHLRFVHHVEFTSIANTHFDKFLFPITVMGRDRVIVMRLDPLLNVEKRLTDQLGTAGSAIMFSEGESYAMETLDQYRNDLGKVSDEALLETVKDGLRATGWGLFEFKALKDGYLVTVDGPPIEEGATEPSKFLCGIIAGIYESLYSSKVRIAESRLDQEKRQVTVRLSRSA